MLWCRETVPAQKVRAWHIAAIVGRIVDGRTVCRPRRSRALELMVEVLNGLTARDALCLLAGRMLAVLDEAPSDEERQQSLDNCIDLLKGVPVSLRH